jgi:hypothetical protein
MTPRSILPQNETILRNRFPLVLQRIIEVGGRMPQDFFYEDRDTGSILMIQRGEFAFPAYGKYKKENLITRWFSSLVLHPESLYAVTGFGDGSHLSHFLDNSTSGTNFLATEKDPSLLRETLARFDLTKLLSNERFILGTGEIDDAFFADIQGAALSGVSDVNSVVFSPLHGVDEGYYDRMRNELVRQYLVVRPLMEVNVRTAIDIQKNTFKNLPHLASSPDVGEMENEFEDIPFILIGAGPSLDESIDFLKQVQDKAIIVASNSPYRKLINNGIRPHLVVTADPLSPTLAGFENVKLDDVPLACPFSAYPEIVRRFSGRILTWCTYNPIIDVLKERMGRKPGTNILEQGTVSGCVLDLSRLFGCKKVILIGQDMSVRDDGRYYSDDTSYSDTGGHYNSSSKGQRLPGNTQEKVLVEGRLFVYLKTFEQFISQNKGIEYRNLARTGVKINGAPYQTYEDALDWIGQTESKSFDHRVEQLLSDQGDCPDLATIFSPVLKYAESILENSLSAAIKTELLPDKFSGTNYADNKQLKDLLNEAGKVNGIVDSNKSFWNFLFEGKTKGELVNYRRKIRDIEFPSKNWSAIQRNKEYFWALSEGAHWLISEMQSFLEVSTTQKDQVLEETKAP